MIQTVRALGVTAVVVASCLGGQAAAQTKQLTLCWAAWDPANALVAKVVAVPEGRFTFGRGR